MSWKKNIFSYFIWLIYALMTGAVLICLFSVAAGETAAGILWATAVFAAAGILVFLIHRFVPKLSGNQMEKHSIRNVTEAAAAVVCMAVGLVLRARGLDGAGQTAAYFEMAQVAPGQNIPQIAHGAVYFYVQILHTVFYFLGNKFMAGIWFQIVLQFGAALLFYYSMRHISGYIAAIITLAFIMCSPYMVQSSLILSPDWFFLFFFMIALAVVVSGHAAKLRFFEFLFLGAVIAVLSFMDIVGLLLLFLAVAVIFCIRENMPGRNQKISALLLCLLGFVIGFTFCTFADAYISDKSVKGVFNAWLALYRPEEFQLPLSYDISGSLTECLLLFGLMALGVFSFWRDKKRDRMKAYTMGVCIVLAASFLGIFTDEMPGNLWLFILLTMLAGISAEECFRRLPAAAEMQKQQPEQADEATPETEKKSNYIENPLPIPKRHKKRVLDYDIDISEDDDFDI